MQLLDFIGKCPDLVVFLLSQLLVLLLQEVDVFFLLFEFCFLLWVSLGFLGKLVEKRNLGIFLMDLCNQILHMLLKIKHFNILCELIFFCSLSRS